MEVRTATEADIAGVLALEARFYPAQWHVSEAFVTEVLQRNHEVLRVLDVNGEIKGHYGFLPLEQEIYEKVLHHEMDEKELASYVLDYKTAKDVYLYFITVMVDIETPNRRELSTCLLGDIPLYLQGLTERGVNIKEIGGIFISDNGVRLAKRFGMKQTGTITYVDGKTYPIYRAAMLS